MHTPNIFYTCKSPNITYIFLFGVVGIIVVHVGVGGDHFHWGCTALRSSRCGSAADVAARRSAAVQHESHRRYIQQLDASLHACRRASTRLPHWMQASSWLRMKRWRPSSQEIPFGMGVKKQRPPPFCTPLSLNIVTFSFRSFRTFSKFFRLQLLKFRTPNFKLEQTF